MDIPFQSTEHGKRETALTNIPQETKTYIIRDKQRPYLAVKRTVDVVVACLLLLALLVPMLIIALLIKLESAGPALFKQQRMGLGGKPFTIYKFRTMKIDAPAEMATREFTDSSDYITCLGGFLRRSSIDELPQLINIIKGDMSFVGYRPVCLTEVKLNEVRALFKTLNLKLVRSINDFALFLAVHLDGNKRASI